MKPFAQSGSAIRVGDQVDDDLVGDQLAGFHDRLDPPPSAVPEATAARSMSPVESWTMPWRLLEPLGLVPLPAPGGPSRIRFIPAVPAAAPS